MQKKLLLAEDSVTIQKVFELAFEKSGVSVIAVDNGDDAVRVAGEIFPDIVVADVTLPGKDGFEVAQAIGAAGTAKEIPVLILSGNMAPFDEERLKACGAKGVLFKPFEAAELMEKVEGFLVKTVPPPVAADSAQPPPPADEHWDFSDVLDEVDEKAPEAKPAAAASSPKVFFPGEILQPAGKDGGADLDEFDVSIDDLEEPAPPVAAATEAASPATEETAASASAAIEEIEEIEELEELEELETGGEAVPVVESHEPHGEKEEEMFGEPSIPVPSDVPLAAAAETREEIPAEILQAELRERFVSRADAIFREVAAEAVEKVMWEMMDRLAGEFSAKIRESVEAVAWEVIPATAEALIREEIARIRTQAGKQTRS